MTVLTETPYEFERRIIKINDADRRGFQLPICPLGANCCGLVTVIRIPMGRMLGSSDTSMWSDEHYIFWPEARGVGAAHHARELIRALLRADELGPTIPR